MRKKHQIEPVFDKSRQRWKLDVPASASDTGKRFRAWFESRQAARDFIGESTTEAAATIPPSLAMDADTARQRIEAAGLDMTLAEIVAAYVEARDAMKGAGTLLEAARAFSRHHDARTSSKPLGEAVTAFLAFKEGTLRDATRKSYSYSLQSVMAPLNARTLADITVEELVGILGEKKPTARAMHVRNLRTFWSWASKEPRTWSSMTTVNALEFRRDAGEGDIEIFRPEEVKALLKAAEGYSPNAAVSFALSIFAGVRQAELEKLTWSDIREDHVEIGATVAKKGKRRMIPICPTLRAWIDAYTPTDADKADFIVGPNWREVSRAVRRLAGWAVAARILDEQPTPTRGAWPANAPRHTCASVLVATGEPLETLIFAFGHSGGHDLLRRHYVSRLTKKDALAILSTGPRGTKVKLVKVA
jgi:integrase